MRRAQRKDEQVYFSMLNAPRRADFSDINLINNCLLNTSYSQISLETVYMGRTFRSPLFINAVTGGTKLALKINAGLAAVARQCGLPMAVGSQKVAFEDRTAEASFKVARRVNPEGVIWANIGSYADSEMAIKAIRMINADGIQIHLNAPQELLMSGGDCDFRGMIERVVDIVNNVQVPVIVKEVGFGIAREQAELLIAAGVTAIDVGGRGGTNFLTIESRRSGKPISGGLNSWGIPTVISLAEVEHVSRGKTELFSSGGMYAALDIAKAIALGADAVGMAGFPVYYLLKEGPQAVVEKVKGIENELRTILMLAGAHKPADLQQVPLVITGFTAEWMQRRGLDPDSFARRPGIIC